MKIFVIFLSMVVGTVQAQQQKPAGFHIEGHVNEPSLIVLNFFIGTEEIFSFYRQ